MTDKYPLYYALREVRGQHEGGCKYGTDRYYDALTGLPLAYIDFDESKGVYYLTFGFGAPPTTENTEWVEYEHA